MYAEVVAGKGTEPNIDLYNMENHLKSVRNYVTDLRSQINKGEITDHQAYEKFAIEYIKDENDGIHKIVERTLRRYDELLNEFSIKFLYDILSHDSFKNEVSSINYEGWFHLSFPETRTEDRNLRCKIPQPLKDSELNSFITRNAETVVGVDWKNFNEVVLEHYKTGIELFKNNNIFMKGGQRIKSNSKSIISKIVEYVMGKESKYISDIGGMVFSTNEYSKLYTLNNIIKKIVGPDNIQSKFKNIPEIFNHIEIDNAVKTASNIASRIAEGYEVPEDQKPKMIVGIWSNFKYKDAIFEFQGLPSDIDGIMRYSSAAHSNYKKEKEKNIRVYAETHEMTELLDVIIVYVHDIFSSYLQKNNNILINKKSRWVSNLNAPAGI